MADPVQELKDMTDLNFGNILVEDLSAPDPAAANFLVDSGRRSDRNIGGTIGTGGRSNLGSDLAKLDSYNSRILIRYTKNLNSVLLGKRNSGTSGIDVAEPGREVMGYREYVNFSSDWSGDWRDLTARNYTYSADNVLYVNTTDYLPSQVFRVGDKIRLSQNNVPTWKYFYVIAVSDTARTVTLYGGSAYTFNNSAPPQKIYSSRVSTPYNFPNWLAFTPVWTNLTVGNASSNLGGVSIDDRVCSFHTYLKWGSTTSISGAVTLTLPITAANYSGTTFLGLCRYVAAGAGYLGIINSAGVISVFNASATYLQNTALSATIPNTWTTNDEIEIQAFYEI